MTSALWTIITKFDDGSVAQMENMGDEDVLASIEGTLANIPSTLSITITRTGTWSPPRSSNFGQWE